MTEIFDVALIHNSQDKPTVRMLAQALKARGLKVWLDEEQVVPGRSWQAALLPILQSSLHSVAVLTGKSGIGPWVSQDMYALLRIFVKRSLPVIPVLLPDAANTPILPLLLNEFTWVDLRGGLTEKGLSMLEWGITGRKPNNFQKTTQAVSFKGDAVYFLSLSLENVRCFGSKQFLDLSDGKGRPAQWVVILGDNSTGKTTLLQTLAGMELTEVIEEKVPVYYTYDIDKTLANSLCRISHTHFSLELKLSFGARLDEKTKEIYVVTYSCPQCSYQSRSWSFRPWLYNEYVTCYPYAANRRLSKGSLTQELSKALTSGLFNDQTELVNAEEWLLQTDYISSKLPEENPSLKARFHLIKEILINILPNIDDIRISIPDVNQSPRAEFKTPDGWLKLDALSLGYQTMISWMVDLAAHMFQRYPDSPNPIAEPAVVLIDEIDLHLHPKWQRTIMAYLSERFVNTQFIVTAHSPLIVQAAENANIVVLKREGDQVVIHQQAQAVKGWRVDQLLTSDLFDLESARSPHYESLLEKRRQILSKATLSETDQSDLRKLEAEIGDLPTAETTEDIEAMDIIRRAAQILQQDA